MANSILSEHVNFSYTNATLLDPFISDISKVTINSSDLPIAVDIAHANAQALTGRYKSTAVSATPSYIDSMIELCYHGSVYKTIPILFPESLSESYGANYIKESPVGSSKPIVAFGHSNASQVTLSFVATSEYLPDEYRHNFEAYLDDLRSMTKPRISGSYVQGPEVRVTLANVYFEGVCDSVNIDYQNVYGDHSYVIANIQCQFTKTN